VWVCFKTNVLLNLFFCLKQQTNAFLLNNLQYWYFVCTSCIFLPRCMECRRGLAMRILSVHQSICLSNACIVTKRKKDMFRFLYHTKDHLAQFSEKKNGWWGATSSTWNFGSTNVGAQKRKTAGFPVKSHFNWRKSAIKFLYVKTASGTVVGHSLA